MSFPSLIKRYEGSERNEFFRVQLLIMYSVELIFVILLVFMKWKLFLWRLSLLIIFLCERCVFVKTDDGGRLESVKSVDRLSVTSSSCLIRLMWLFFDESVSPLHRKIAKMVIMNIIYFDQVLILMLQR